MLFAPKISPSISIVIPSYNRGKVLVETIDYLLALPTSAKQIIVVDQTPVQPDIIQQRLRQWHVANTIQWIVLERPSVVAAMNRGLGAANSDYVLFLDDDVKPKSDLILEYRTFIEQQSAGIIAGRVIQPWDNAEGIPDNSCNNFSFNGLKNCNAESFIGCNVLIEKNTALNLGGFDENFVGTAHDYEREFTDRVLNAGLPVWYCSSAVVDHLKEESGGIRSYGHFLKTMKPHHAVGAYYYILRSKRVNNKVSRIFSRLIQRLVTRTHLKQPWWIIGTLVGDILGLFWAIHLRLSGPTLMKQE